MIRSFHFHLFLHVTSYMRSVKSFLYVRTLLIPMLYAYSIGMSIFCQFTVIFILNYFSSSKFNIHVLSSFPGELHCWIWHGNNVLRSVVLHRRSGWNYWGKMWKLNFTTLIKMTNAKSMWTAVRCHFNFTYFKSGRFLQD